MSSGADISAFQGRVNFDALRPAVAFVIIKATEGNGFTDGAFGRNWRECARVGLRRGAYHFGRPDLSSTATIEADWFVDQIAGEGGFVAGDILALDYEVSWSGDVVGWCRTWLDRVSAQTGIAPYIYLNLSLVHGYDWTTVIAAGYPLWLAYYDQQPNLMPQTPWPRVAIKQWTSTGTLPGILGNVDLNTAQEVVDMTRDDVIALLAEYGIDKFKVPALVKEFEQHKHVVPPNLTSGPIVPPFDGAQWFGASSDLSAIGWNDPATGKTRWFKNGVEVTQ